MITAKRKVTFDVREEINLNYRDIWRSKVPNHVLKGGRTSFKSSVIAMKTVRDLLEYIESGETANVVVIRKVANTIRDSVFLSYRSFALPKFGIENQFSYTVAPFKIIHKQTGSGIHFYGQDDFAKLKSNAIENIIAVWYEEAAEFNSYEEFDQTNATFMRNKHPQAKHVKFYWSYNPPRNPYSWINEWAESLKGEPNYIVHSSTYLDDKLNLVTPQMLEEIDRIKKNDFDYYRYLYLGEPVGLGTNIYNMDTVNHVDSLPVGENIVEVGYSADTGHQVSATAVLLFGITNKRNLFLLDLFYYSPQGKVRKKAPSELSKDIYEYIKSKNYLGYDLTIDSAEGALRNQYYKDFGERWTPVSKQKKHIMIDYTHSLLAQGRFYVIKNKNTDIFMEEMKQYSWDEKTIKTENPQPIKENDHTIDAFQYYIVNHARRLNVRF